MPSLIQQLAQAQTQANLRPTNKRVTVYAPGRGLPNGPVRQQQQQRQGPVQRPSGTRPSRAQSENRGDLMAQAERAFLTSPEAQKQAQEKAQKAAEDAAWDDKDWWEKGLGTVLSNPIVSNVLKPLSVLSTPGKAIVAGLEGALEHTPLGHIQDAPDWLKTAMMFNPATLPLGILAHTDSARTEADDRSFWEKIKPDSDYGFGQLLDGDNPDWMNKALGLTGDVASDPLTWVAPVATRMSGALEKGAKAAEAATATEKATGFLDDAARAAAAGNFEDVAKASRLGAEQEAIARRAAADADAIVSKRVPVHQGRKARAQLIGEIAENNPDLVAKYGPELQKAGQQGFNTIKDQGLRDALGLSDPAIRIGGAGGMAIPGTRGLTEKLAEGGGFLRKGMDKLPVGARFAPQGLEESLNVLTRGGKGDVLKAGTTVRIQNLMRRGAGQMEARGNKALTDMVRQLRGIGGEEEIRALFRQAETDATPNVLNKFFGETMPQIYEKVAGRPMGVGRDPATYIPHMHTPEGRRFLATLDRDVVEDMGFVADDLLEGSKYLEKSRKLTPDTIGVPKEFEIGDRGTITLTDGTVEELNDQLGQLFPEFKGRKFYQDDPVKIGEAYVSSVSRQAGRDLALDKLAESKNPLVREVSGQLLEDVNTRNQFLRRNPIIETVRKGYTAGQRIAPVGPKGDMPVTASDDILGVTKHFDETQAQRDYIMKEGKEFVGEVGKDVTKTRSTLADNLKGLRKTLMDGLRKRETEATAQIKAINVQLGRMDEEIRKIGPLTSENVDDLVAVHQTVDNHIVNTKAEIKKIRDRYGKKIPRDQARVDRELNKTLRHLEDQADQVRAQYAKGSSEMRAEARARKTALEAPVEKAQVALDHAEAAHPRPVSKQRVQEANAYIRTNFESEDAFELERQRYVAELQRMRDEGIPIYRTVDGRLTPETTEAVQAAVTGSKVEAPLYPSGTPLDKITAQSAEPDFIPAATPPPTPGTVSSTTPAEQLKQAMARQATPAGPTPAQYSEARDVMQNSLLDIVDEDNLDQVDAIGTLSDRDTVQFATETWDILPPEAQQRLRELGIEPGAAAPTATPEQLALPAGGAPEAPAPVVAPPALDTKLVKQSDGTYLSGDEFAVSKEGSQWRVTLAGEDDFGLYPTLKEARAEVAHQQEMLNIPVGGAPAEVAAPAAAAEAVTPSPTPAPPLAPVAETKPSTKRITRKWEMQEGAGGRQVEALQGPDKGWTIEPYEESIRRTPADQAKGFLPPKAPGPRLPVGPLGEAAEGPRRLRYVAFHEGDNALAGRSFTSAREAKIAVEDMLRRRRHQVTIEEYAARGNAATPKVAATFENLGNERVIPPSGLTPEEAAANRAAAQGAPNLERPADVTTMGPNELALTEEGAALQAMRPAGPPTISDPYVKAYNDWQAMKARSEDMSLTKAERSKAKRTATSMGGAFTQTTGKHYQRHAAEQIMINDAAWQLERDYDLAVVKARQEYEAAVTNADNQVEAMVYTKHHNPITGTDEYTRLPSGSNIGFGDGGERVPVQVEPPRQGTVTSGVAPDTGEWESRVSPGQRAADRRQIDEEMSSVLLMPENEQKFRDLVHQGESLSERIDNSVANENRLNQLDQAAKDAYTQEVRDADAAVLEAKRLEAKALADQEAGNVMGAGLAYEEAKRNTQRVITEQTAARQAWMEADRAWKVELAWRDEYQKAVNDVTSAEQALHSGRLGGGSQPFIDAAREGTDIPLVGGKPASRETQKLTRNLRQAYQKLDAMDAAGRTFLTDTQRRNLAGQLNSIDLSKRELINQVMQPGTPGRVTPPQAIVPREGVQQAWEEDMIRRRPDTSPERFGFESSPQGAPPAPRGTGDDLAARAYAESFAPTEPGQAPSWSLSPEGALQQNEKLSGRQPYQPRTEREAIAGLQSEATKREATPQLQSELGNIERQAEAEKTIAQQSKDEIELLGRAERNEKLAPLADRVQTYTAVNDALHRKEKLIPQRAEAQAQRKIVVDAKVTKKADLVQVADDIEKVAKQNPDLLDDDIAVVEALLQDTRREAERVTDNDLTAKQVQGLIDKVGTKNDNSLDIMLTTVGKNWKMLYDANGAKRAVLQEGDTILQADLHRMFTNLYEIKKDRVLFGRTLNALTNLFKTYATLSPGFHVRNALSAMFMNATDGVALGTQFSAAKIWRDYMKAEDSEAWLDGLTHLHGFTGDEIRGAMAATHGSGAGGRFTEAGFAEKLDTGHWTDKLGGLQRNKLTRFSQRVGERVEGSVRMAMALDSMRAGDDIESAVQRINRIHFDYGEISTLDANMKRIIPFWTFMSRNMPMQVSQMWTHPQVYLGYQRFVKNVSATDEEYTPEYWKKAGAWNTGLKVPDFVPESFGGGLPISVQPDLGFTRLESDLKDYEDFLSGERLGGVLSAGNPLYTAPIEYATRTDLFTGQKFEEGETVPVKGIGGLPWQLLARLTGQSKDGEVDAAFMNAIRAVNPIQDRETRLLPQITGGDPEGQKRQLESWARFIGVPGRTLTPKQQDNEFFRRYYDQLDAAKLEQKRLQRQAG